MSFRRVWAIFIKDVKAAITDGRVLVAILVPIALAAFYNFATPEFDEGLEATVAHTPELRALPEALRRAGGSNATLSFMVGDAAEVRRLVTAEEVNVGFVAPPGFEEAVRQGSAPELTVLLTADGGIAGPFVAGLLEEALRELAGQEAPARIRTEALGAPAAEQGNVFAQLGIRRYLVLSSLMFLVVMVCMLAVPVILAEESEKRTLDALVMISSYAEVIAAKALVGIVYVAIAVALLMALTQLAVTNIPLFVAALAAITVTLIGFGLLMGALFRNANQLNTWSGFLLMPVMIPVFLVGFPLPETVQTALAVIPTSQATRLAIDGLAGQPVFGGAPIGFLVIALWGVVAYALLLWLLRRRQA